ncbi:hypothetical protein SETIT_3G274500v2 [Setaria italica]|uniref:Alpha/beta hydrolase fold-3 domain-containing protein n=1 Tax=Setaria italica TaxID=4555 RepID=K3ZFH3_SETIT|nr:hypothetical protein SETIT_3G274500v2 [Setaria italica]
MFYDDGVFIIESTFTLLYHAYLNMVAAKAHVVAVPVEYRLVPKHQLPAAYDDSWQALNWVTRNTTSEPESWLWDRGNLSRLFVAGDSAGANIAHNMAMRVGTEDGLDGGAAITGLLLLDPYFWGKEPMVGRRRTRVVSSRMAVTSSGLDDFRPQDLAYAAVLNGSGWGREVEQYETPDERHVYFLDRPKDPNSVKELAFVTSFQ